MTKKKKEVRIEEARAAKFFKVALRTLRRWRIAGIGPKYEKEGRRIYYRLADLEAFEKEQMMIIRKDSEFANEELAAKYLGFACRTLRRWRASGRGPKYSTIGRRIRYRYKDLDLFLSQSLGVKNAKDLLTQTEAGAMLGVNERTLRRWRKHGDGPRVVKTGRRLLYPKAEVENYIDKTKIEMAID